MNADIICIGKMREKHYRAAADEYIKRLSRYGKVEEIELPDLPEPVNASDETRRQIKVREGEAILSRIKNGAYVVAMCIEGRQKESVAFSKHMDRLQCEGRGRLTFIIGGSLGLSDDVIARADEHMSMSAMTFPHQLARVMLLEQLYRACKIASNEKYHK